MIVIDIEASGGLNFHNVGVWQLGAVEFENPSNTFFQEARVDDEDDVESEALKVTGKTEAELRNKNKQSQKELLKNFFDWVMKIENKIFVSHNPFDYGLIRMKAGKYGLKIPFSYRTYDLHVFAVAKYFEIHKNLPMENGESTFNLSKILEFCGIKDKRVRLEDGQVVQNGNPHNGLEDARLEAECLSRILYGKSLFKDFEEEEIPEYLRRKL